MHFTKLIKTSAYSPPAVAPQPQPEQTSELVQLLRKLTNEKDIVQTMPHVLEETILSDDEVNDILSHLLDFNTKYFPNIPLSKDIVKQFLWNAPRDIVRGMRYSENHPGLPDILNPVMYLYPLLMKDPSDAIGLYWQTLSKLLDGNREAIKNDAAAYIADLNFEANVEKYDDQPLAEGDYEVVDINPGQEDGEIPYDE